MDEMANAYETIERLSRESERLKIKIEQLEKSTATRKRA